MLDTKTLAQTFPAEIWAALVACFTIICGLGTVIYNRMNSDIKAHDTQLDNGQKRFEEIGTELVRLKEREIAISAELETYKKKVDELKNELQEMQIDCAKQHGGKPNAAN